MFLCYNLIKRFVIISKTAKFMASRIEKWNYQPKIDDPNHLVAPPILRRESRFDEMLEVEELEKTKEEKRITRDMNRAAKRVLKRLGLERLEVPQKAIHVVDPIRYEKVVRENPEDSDEASILGGHIYVPRNHDINQFIKHLSHEMAHEFSYLRKKLIVRPKDKGRINIITRDQRRGYRTELADKMLFVGVNEAMAEFFAAAIRYEYCQLIQASNKVEDKLSAIDAYIPQVMLMEKFFKLYDGQDGDEGYIQFMRGFITGDMSFMQRLHQYKRGSVKILAEMDTKKEDALRAAEELGFDDVAEQIRGCG
jgi:hypothetical protein